MSPFYCRGCLRQKMTVAPSISIASPKKMDCGIVAPVFKKTKAERTIAPVANKNIFFISVLRGYLT
ncbi:MAG: hypothetical protein UW92_C0002G0021 [Candidatus Jorgensenbacteria bacterium GW2011_GWA2_45_13]|uniref:Uncharacterized protein n=1 Tax=Candidatus Jorgensenbacteria bacterium GW2011_GWA2_45_13 TaxID=1618662 RepID=A0A0G1NGY5_9BACT|nr:MAG: hypothetical protein UW92_C0002G0021 [Candidatus Jorgensenbacteria bacterium GW2011_GWA2_45_13]